MKTSRFFCLFLLCSTSALSQRSQLPTFSWLKNQDRLKETDPLLKIDFPDGDHDVIRFHKVHRFYDDMDECMMYGALENEPGVSVTLTGSCLDSEDFEMTIVGSGRLRHSTFKVTNGKVESTEHGEVRGSFRNAVPASGLPNVRQQPPFPGVPIFKHKVPYNAWFNIHMYADPYFRNNFGEDRKIMINMYKIAGHAQTWFSVKNLKPEMIIEASIPENWNINETIYATDECLDELAVWLHTARNYKAAKFNRTVYLRDTVGVFFGMSGYFDKTAGKSILGALCNVKMGNSILAIVNHWKYIAKTGASLAHELAHSLGVPHDFDSSRRYLTDSEGNSCYTPGSLMDYFSKYTTWSNCSIEFLRKRFEDADLLCLPMNLND